MSNNFSVDPVSALHTWAKVAKISGITLGLIVFLSGSIIALNAYDSAFGIFMVYLIAAGAVIAGGMLVSHVLEVEAMIAENTSTCLSYLRSMYHSNSTSKSKSVAMEQPSVSETAVIYDQPKEKTPLPTEPWICLHCGTENLPYDNVCNKCGKLNK